MNRRILLSGMLSLLLLAGSQLWSQTGSFFEDFNSVSTPDLPAGWSGIVETTSSGFVRTATLYTPLTPPNHLQFSNSFDANATLVLISPLVNNFETNWLNFYAKLSGATHEGNLIVGVMSDNTDLQTFTPLNTLPVAGNVYQQQFISFPETYLDTDEYYIAFKFESAGTLRNLLLDNITWEEAPDGPVFTFSPEDGDFAWADINGQRTRSFTITNTGAGTLTVNEVDVTFSGVDADYFSVPETTVFPFELSTGESAQLPVVFAPLTEGPKTANLEVTHNADDSPFILELSGQGLPLLSDYMESFDESTAFPAGWSAIVEASTTFAGIAISATGNAWSLPNHVRFSNSSDLNALLLLVGPRVNNFEDNWVSFYAKQNIGTHEEDVIVGVMTDRYDAESFIPVETVLVSGNVYQFYGVSIPEGYSNEDEYHIAFKSAATATNRILMMDDISWGPEPADPIFTITPDEGVFGDVYLDETSTPKTFIVNNSGAGSFQIQDATDIFITGADEVAFDLILDEELTFPIALATGESFSFQVTFTPTEIRLYNATLNIVDDIGTKAVNEVALSGMGYDPTVTPDVLYNFVDVFPPVDWMRYSGLLEEVSELAPVTGTWVHGRFGNEGEDNNSARINLWGANVKHWLITPPIDLSTADTDYQLDFDLALTARTSTNPSVLGEEQYVAVVISTDGGLTWSSDNILMQWTSEDSISHTGQTASIDLSAYDGVVKIAFYAESTAGGFFDGVDVFVTNVEITGTYTGPLANFFEDFNSISTPNLPEGWTKIEETTSSGFVRTATLFTPLSPPNHLQFSNSFDANATLMLISPEVTRFESNWLNFFTKLSGATHDGNLIVGLMSDPTDADSFLPVNTISVSGNVYQQKFMFFPEEYANDDVYHIAFKFESAGTLRNLLLDNITWEEAPDGPIFSFSPENGNFSWADVNGQRTRTYNISNTGSETLTITEGDVVFTGDDADYFSVAETAAFPFELLTGESAELPVVFAPLSAGIKTATLEIAHNADASPFTLELTGEGLPLLSEYMESFDESTAFPAGWSAIVEASTTFAGIAISATGNAWSLPNHVRFSNSSDLNALLLLVGPRVNNFEDNWVSFYGKQNFAAHEENVVIGVMTDRYDASTFVPVDTVLVAGNAYKFYGVSIPEGYTNEDEYHIAFKSAATATNRILMMDDISWGPEPVDPIFTITPEEGGFGDVYLDETSTPITFVINNTGTGSFQIEAQTDIFISGADENAFELILDEELAFPITLTTGESFSVQVTFSPTQIRQYDATLNIVDDIGTKAVNEVPLSGMGYDPTVTPYVLYDFVDEFPPLDWMRFSGFLVEESELAPVTGTWVHGRFGNEGEDNNSARINLWGANVRHWMVTPPIDLSAVDTDYQLEFDLALTARTSTNPSVLGEEQFVAVVISTDGGLTWSSGDILMQWTSEDNISATGDNISIDLKDYNGVVKIAFYAESTAGGFFDGVDVFVTNVEVKEREAYNLTFEVNDEEGAAIADAQIVLNGMEYAPGFYAFEDLITGNYSYTVFKEGYLDVTGQVTLADQDVTVEVLLIEDNPTFTLTFVVDDEDEILISDAVITLDGVAYDAGVYVFEELEAGTYNYSVEKEGFVTSSGEAVITDQDLTVEVTLLALPVYTVTFVVEDEEGVAIDDAIITFDGNTYATGVYVFEDLLAATYDYSVAREGFITANGEVEVVDEDVTVTVALEEAPFTLTLVANPVTGGTLTGAGDYLAGATVNIEATASEGYFFINWTDSEGVEISDNAAATLTMPAEDLTLTAHFGLTDYTVSLNAAPEDAGTLTGEGTYNMGDEVTVNAVANAGYAFVNWTDEGVEVSDVAEYTFAMPAENVELTANFEPLPFNLTLEVAPEATGAVTGAGEYLFGADVSITATPDTGYAFVNWTDEDGTEVSDMAEYTFAMPAEDITLTANFTLAEYTLTLLVEPEGTGTVSGDGNYTMGSFILISATPEPGYEFVNWTDADGNEISANASHSITMPAEDITYTANFQLSSYELTLSALPEEGGMVTGAGTYEFGETVNISAVPETGYAFANWTDEDGTMVAETADYTFDMPAEDVALIANFVLLSYDLSIEVLPAEAGTAAGDGSYAFNEEVTVTATANEGFAFENWTDDAGVVLSEEEQYTFLMPAEDLVLKANFVPFVSVDEVALTNLRVYPNPSRSFINIEHTETILEVKVYSLNGQLVHTAVNDHTLYQLNVDNMETGIYLLQVRTASGMATHRIQVIQ